MKGFRLAVLSLIFLSVLAHSSHAEYWFQSGAQGGTDSYYNTGASVSIETVYQNVSAGSLAYWVGENLQNGAFVQVGYVIENASGEYPGICDTQGCSGYEYLQAGVPHWFYEYFPSHYNSSFLGVIGSNVISLANGSFHKYGFYASGDVWYFTVDGVVVGSVNLGTGSSGRNEPVAFGELANASGNSQFLTPVIFSNLSAGSMPLADGYSYIGYGVGSRTDLSNKYGVGEVGGRTDYFEVGSGIALQNNDTQLWKQGYYLTIRSAYGNVGSSFRYEEYNHTEISEPYTVYVGDGTREVFEGWSGSGSGSYTGPYNSSVVAMLGNVTEQAEWQTQYYLNVSSSAGGAVNGSGWYDAGQLAHYSLQSNMIYENSSSRLDFGGWSIGGNAMSEQVAVSGPLTVYADWTQEYLVNAISQRGSVSGDGWYPAGSSAVVSLSGSTENISDVERSAFYSWSNNNTGTSFDYKVNEPLLITAVFRNQYLIDFDVIDQNGSSVGGAQLYLDNAPEPDPVFLYSNKTYTISSVYYNGATMTIGARLSVNSSETVPVLAPLYNVRIITDDAFGAPVDADLSLSFVNGSGLSLSTSPSGSILIDNVPYGKVNGVATYLGMREYISTQDKGSLRILFVSVIDVAVLAAALIVSLLIYFVSKRHIERPQSR